MDKDIRLTVVGTQTDDSGHKDTQTTVSDGTYFVKGQKRYIFVKENPATQDSTAGVTAQDSTAGITAQDSTAGTATTRYVFDHRSLEIVRNGDVKGSLVFEAGREHSVDYETPIGRLNLIFFTKGYCLTEDEKRVRITISYTISDENGVISNNHTEVTVEERMNSPQLD